MDLERRRRRVGVYERGRGVLEGEYDRLLLLRALDLELREEGDEDPEEDLEYRRRPRLCLSGSTTVVRTGAGC